MLYSDERIIWHWAFELYFDTTRFHIHAATCPFHRFWWIFPYVFGMGEANQVPTGANSDKRQFTNQKLLMNTD